jgi:DNA-directed RNA polymerase subunit RPC12/RpoP
MIKCQKCNSESVGWVSDPTYDESDGTYFAGYYKCAICGHIIFQDQEEQNAGMQGLSYRKTAL